MLQNLTKILSVLAPKAREDYVQLLLNLEMVSEMESRVLHGSCTVLC